MSKEIINVENENIKEEIINTENESIKEELTTEEIESTKEDIKEEKEIKKQNEDKKVSIWNKKIKGKKKVLIIICLIGVFIGLITGVILILKNTKVEGFKFKKENHVSSTYKPTRTYKEYIKSSKEYYYERLVVNIGKDYAGIVTLGEEIIFIKEKTNQKVIMYIKENKVSKKDAVEGLIKYVKKLNKDVELDKVVELNKNEFHIYKGKEKDGKNIKYVIVASDATRILLTYTYNNKGEDEDMEYILKSMRF